MQNPPGRIRTRLRCHIDGFCLFLLIGQHLSVSVRGPELVILKSLGTFDIFSLTRRVGVQSSSVNPLKPKIYSTVQSQIQDVTFACLCVPIPDVNVHIPRAWSGYAHALVRFSVRARIQTGCHVRSSHKDISWVIARVSRAWNQDSGVESRATRRLESTESRLFCNLFLIWSVLVRQSF